MKRSLLNLLTSSVIDKIQEIHSYRFTVNLQPAKTTCALITHIDRKCCFIPLYNSFSRFPKNKAGHYTLPVYPNSYVLVKYPQEITNQLSGFFLLFCFVCLFVLGCFFPYFYYFTIYRNSFTLAVFVLVVVSVLLFLFLLIYNMQKQFHIGCFCSCGFCPISIDSQYVETVSRFYIRFIERDVLPLNSPLTYQVWR